MSSGRNGDSRLRGHPGAVLGESGPRGDYAGPATQLTPCSSSSSEQLQPQPTPTGASVRDLGSYISQMLGDACCKSDQQYEQLQTDAKSLTSDLPAKVGLMEGNREKNRYIDILPFDENRVALNGGGYVNASFVSGPNGGREFVACQGPKASTVSDHWRMVWEQRIALSVMLTGCKEAGKSKCEQYWPETEGASLSFDRGMLVTLTGVDNCDTYVVRRLRVTVDDPSDGAEEDGLREDLNTVLMQYLEWADHAVPNLDEFASFLTEVRSYISPQSDTPILVHCSAGVGRTGTFVALDILVRQLQQADADASISVYDTVLQLRRCRPRMVQIKHQYAFIYRFLLNYIKKNKHGAIASGGSDDPVYVTARINRAFDPN